MGGDLCRLGSRQRKIPFPFAHDPPLLSATRPRKIRKVDPGGDRFQKLQDGPIKIAKESGLRRRGNDLEIFWLALQFTSPCRPALPVVLLTRCTRPQAGQVTAS
jgi:hypothetical protein